MFNNLGSLAMVTAAKEAVRSGRETRVMNHKELMARGK